MDAAAVVVTAWGVPLRHWQGCSAALIHHLADCNAPAGIMNVTNPIMNAVAWTHRQDLPGVLHCVQLIEVVLTAIAAHLQLRPYLHSHAGPTVTHIMRGVLASCLDALNLCAVQLGLPMMLHWTPPRQVKHHSLALWPVTSISAAVNAKLQLDKVVLPQAAAMYNINKPRMHSHSVRGTSLLGCFDAVKDPFQVALKVHGPLVQAACCQRSQPSPHDSSTDLPTAPVGPGS